MAVGSTRAVAAPSADTWYEVAHDFSSDVCDPDVKDVCKLSIDGTRMDCQTGFTTETGGQGAKAYIIRNESDPGETDICDGYDYCAVGAMKTSASTEVTFYCPFNGGDITEIVLHGTDDADVLWFHLDPNDEFDLEEHPGVSFVTGVIIGGDMGDDLHGSRHDGAAYGETIRADGGADTVDSHAGKDTVYSGTGADTIFTGPGNDTVWLDTGPNAVSTEEDNDVVYGGPDTDKVHLGTGDDIAFLGSGEDVGCGGEGEDDLNGGGEADQLWGDEHDDDLDGGAPGSTPGDACGSEGAYGSTLSCESTLHVEPSDCPPEHAP